MKHFTAIIAIIIVILFSSNAIAAADEAPALNKIFHIDASKKEAKAKQKPGVKTIKPEDNPALSENEKLYVELGDAYTKSKLYKSAMEA